MIDFVLAKLEMVARNNGPDAELARMFQRYILAKHREVLAVGGDELLKFDMAMAKILFPSEVAI